MKSTFNLLAVQDKGHDELEHGAEQLEHPAKRRRRGAEAAPLDSKGRKSRHGFESL